MRMVRALIRLHRAFSPLTVGQRVHVLIRFFTCPFLRILDFIPPGRILDLGAGHGIVSYLANANEARRMTAIDPDVRKVVQWHAPGVRWIAGYDDALRGTFDGIV